MCLLNDEILCVGANVFKGIFLIKISTHELIGNYLNLNVSSIIKYQNGLLCGVENKNGNNSIIQLKYDKYNLIKIYEEECAH